MQKIDIEIENFIDKIQSSGTAIIPTDTIPGIACNAFDNDGVLKIFEIKNRVKTKPYAIFTYSTHWIAENCFITKEQLDYITLLLPGAYTIVAKVKSKALIKNLSPLIIKDDIIGIRIPSNEVCLKASKLFTQGLIAATSVNLSGFEPAKDYKSMDSQVINKVDFIFSETFFTNMSGKPSTIIDITEPVLKITQR
jgi:L-threonylcarbamoyladenylate synthase